MIQGGDILSRDSNRENDGTGSPGWTVKSEFSSLKHKRGIVSMAVLMILIQQDHNFLFAYKMLHGWMVSIQFLAR